jgi:hypothetical protein
VRLHQVLQSGQTGNYVHNLAGSHRNYHLPPYCARGHHPLAPLTPHLDPAKSRLLAPTKSSAAQAISRDFSDLDPEALRTGQTSKSVSRSASPKKEVITTKLPGPSKPVFTSTVATHTRLGRKNSSRSLLPPVELPRARRPRAPPSTKPLQLVTTLETAHAPSPRELTFRTSSTFEVNPLLKSFSPLSLSSDSGTDKALQTSPMATRLASPVEQAPIEHPIPPAE